ncbi:MAG: hypothetical protein QXI58_03490, partial [Candidatus Micrarchaeia archaeon]
VLVVPAWSFYPLYSEIENKMAGKVEKTEIITEKFFGIFPIKSNAIKIWKPEDKQRLVEIIEKFEAEHIRDPKNRMPKEKLEEIKNFKGIIYVLSNNYSPVLFEPRHVEEVKKLALK